MERNMRGACKWPRGALKTSKKLERTDKVATMLDDVITKVAVPIYTAQKKTKSVTWASTSARPPSEPPKSASVQPKIGFKGVDDMVGYQTERLQENQYDIELMESERRLLAEFVAHAKKELYKVLLLHRQTINRDKELGYISGPVDDLAQELDYRIALFENERPRIVARRVVDTLKDIHRLWHGMELMRFAAQPGWTYSMMRGRGGEKGQCPSTPPTSPVANKTKADKDDPSPFNRRIDVKSWDIGPSHMEYNPRLLREKDNMKEKIEMYAKSFPRRSRLLKPSMEDLHVKIGPQVPESKYDLQKEEEYSCREKMTTDATPVTIRYDDRWSLFNRTPVMSVKKDADNPGKYDLTPKMDELKERDVEEDTLRTIDIMIKENSIAKRIETTRRYPMSTTNLDGTMLDLAEDYKDYKVADADQHLVTKHEAKMRELKNPGNSITDIRVRYKDEPRKCAKPPRRRRF